ncbi:4855_t:CDS:1 [Paraglomus brasilianum]|uniref:4855_t:CDS:1 n=1 Tax=Paraglomus brasilianum TaxID=144538 RepID=A0A9N9FFH0_9GLOM|nr:4855_t:CDS:1 [Paraglomus brasilianum]
MYFPPSYDIVTMNEPNDMNNGYAKHYNNTNVCQSSYPENFNFDDRNPPIQTHVNLQAQSHTQDFLPSASFTLPYNNMTSITMDSMDHGNVGSYYYCTHMGNMDMMNGHLNPPRHNQVETNASSSCPLPGSFQPFCSPSVPYSDTMNCGPTNNYSQHFGMINNSPTSYIFTHDPTGTGYVVTKVEHTQLGRMSAADFNQMLATTRT